MATHASASRLRARVVGHLPQPVSRAVGVAAGSRIVVLGGLTTGDVTTSRVVAIEIVRPHRVTVTADGTLPQPAHDASGASLRGHAVVFGGGAATELSTVQSWIDGRTRVVGRMPAPRSDSAAVTVADTAYVVGGFDGSAMTRTILATRDGRRFRAAGKLRVGVRYPAVATFGGQVYVLGGQLATTEATSTGAQSDVVQRFDPRTGRTTIVGHLRRTLGHAMAFALAGRLYVAGGRHGTTATARIRRIDIGDRGVRTSPAGRLPFALSDAAVVAQGRLGVVLVGGETTGPYAPQRTIIDITSR